MIQPIIVIVRLTMGPDIGGLEVYLCRSLNFIS